VKAKKKILLVSGVILFTVYFFGAARPIPLETVLVPRWLNSLESGNPVSLNNGHSVPEGLLPFSLGGRFGYAGTDGNFTINQVKKANISLSPGLWAEYEAEPELISICANNGETLYVIENPRGYPFFLDGRTFLIGSEQNSVSEINLAGDVAWTYEFASPLTCADSASGLLIAGTLDGMLAVLDRQGRQVFSFEPGGSRYSVILGCALSRDGLRLALVSGIDDQRILLLERFGTGEYKVVYHEFLGNGFPRPVYVSFIENDRWIVFEREGGLGFYEIGSRQSEKVELGGEIEALDCNGGQDLVFAVVSGSGIQKKLVGIKLPGRVTIEAPFKSGDVFLGRIDSLLFVGGGQTMVSFDLEKR